MGEGIVGVIPIEISKHKFNEIKNDYPQICEDIFTPAKNKRKDYTLSPKIFFDNIKPFVKEFYSIIKPESLKQNNDDWDIYGWDARDWGGKGVETTGWKKELDRYAAENNLTTYINARMSSHSYDLPHILGCDLFLFYNGSYKAYFEEESSLIHMTRLLAKAIDNPLAKIAFFTLYG
ncbi:MAG: hypothetical protein LBR22_11650 [Desulfovibrio sp.]|jgi:hypothetical protein|nr:hypothetical protein [Desulfovibrio sp.]